MAKIKIYIEGGGKKLLNLKLRRAFMTLIKNFGQNEKRFDIVAAGARGETLKNAKNCTAQDKILVDSEEMVTSTSKWQHLSNNENLNKPAHLSENNLYFMATCMESWLIINKTTLKQYFGNNFDENKLKQNPQNQNIKKEDVLNSLKEATKNCAKKYSKNLAFDILNDCDPRLIAVNNSFAKEFFVNL